MLSEQLLAQWRRLVAFMKAISHGPPPSGDARDSTGAPPWRLKWSAKWKHFASSF